MISLAFTVTYSFMKREDNVFFCDIHVHATSRFLECETAELHSMLYAEPCGEDLAAQIVRLRKGVDYVAEQWDVKPVFMRYFMTDATNQAEYIPEETDCAVSIIQQPPLDGNKVVLWVYFVRCSNIYNVKEKNAVVGSTTVVEHNGYKHLWNMGMCVPQGGSDYQTSELLNAYEAVLAERNLNIADHCQRTWFFVRDVDTNYAGLVVARRDNFTEQGLTSDTHYIASTGIGGSPAETKALVQLGCYALDGFQKEQIKYLYAPTHLNPTYEYGVTFERGTSIEFGDRKHVYISGTASINNKGEVVHVGNIEKQAERMCENVDTLLAEAGSGPADVMQVIVYLRDIADYKVAKEIVGYHYQGAPIVYTLAPVCRPQWLIEMECIAINEKGNPDFRPF